MSAEVKATFTLIIETTNGCLTVEAIVSGASHVKQQPLDLSVVNTYENTLRLLAKKPKDVDVEALEALGQALYNALFLSEIADAFVATERSLKRAQDSIRIRIQTSIPEIARLPWEVMHDGKEFIALRRRVVIVRGIGNVATDLRTDVGRKLKILYAWSNPSDLPPLTLREPAKQIESLLRGNERIHFVILENASLESLSRSLLDDYHVLCFAGHGTAEHLYLENGAGHERISAQTLANKLETKPTRLVFLAACKAGGQTKDDLPGFAQTLANAVEVPAIAAMQYEVNDDKANLLTARYLEALAKLRPVDVALAEARDAIYEGEQVVRDVFSPVLYLQTDSSRLFRAPRNWIALAVSVFAIVTLLALVLQTAIFQPDRTQIAAARQTAEVEANNRRTAEAGATVESKARATAQAGATIEGVQRATAIANADIQATARSFAEEVGQESQRTALSQELIAHSRNYLEDNPPLALLLAIEADRIANTNLLSTQLALLAGLIDYPYLKTFLGNDVRAVAFSPSNSVFALDSSGDIVLLDIESPQSALQVFSTTDGVINENRLEFDSSGRQLAIVDGHEVILWDVIANREIGRLSKGHFTSIEDVAFNPRQNVLASIDNKGAIILWNIETQTEVEMVIGQHVRLDRDVGHASLSFSPDGQFLASVFSRDIPRILLWDMLEHQFVLEYSGEVLESDLEFNPEEFYTMKWNVAFSSDGNHLLLGIGVPDKASDSANLIFINMEDLTRSISELQVPYELSYIPRFDWDGNVIAFISSDGELCLWDIWNNTEINCLNYHATGSVFLSPYNTLLVSDLNGLYVLSDYMTQPYLNQMLFQPGFNVRSVGNEEDNSFFMLGNGGEIVSIDASTHLTSTIHDVVLSYEDYFKLGGEISTELIALNSTKSTLAIEDKDTILFLDLNDNVLRQNAIDLSKLSRLTSLKYSPDGKMLVSGHEDGTLNIWSSMTQEHLSSLHGPRSSIQKLIFSPDSTLLAAISLNDFQVYLWDLSTFMPIQNSIALSKANLVSFSADSKKVAIDYFGNIRLWNIEDGREYALLEPSFTAASMAFDSYGNYLLVGGSRGEIAIWSIQEERVLGEVDLTVISSELGTQVTNTAFNKDGSLLLLTLSASKFSDSTVILWDMQADSLQKRACQIANRDLTSIEWRQFFGAESYRKTCSNF